MSLCFDCLSSLFDKGNNDSKGNDKLFSKRRKKGKITKLKKQHVGKFLPVQPLAAAHTPNRRALAFPPGFRYSMDSEYFKNEK